MNYSKKKVIALILCLAIVLGIGNSVFSQLSQETVPTAASEQQKTEQETEKEPEKTPKEDDSEGGFLQLVRKKLQKPAETVPAQPGATVYCTISFETNGGVKLEPILLAQGTRLDNLPTATKLGSIFSGWFYDAALSAPVKAEDTVSESKTLYAGYQESSPLVASETPQFASMLDVGTSFAITVLSSDAAMSAEEVAAGITAKNLTDPTVKDLITVSGSNGKYTVAGKGGFVAGASFKIVLEDERLTYENHLPSVRNYNFTTAKAEVLNMQLAPDMKYIAMEELRNIVNDGQQVDALSLALYQADTSGNISPADLTTGSFTYTGSASFAAGDTVAVYAGQRPDLRTLESTKEENGALAYVTLTAVDGQQISYQSAAPEEVIFEPDMLPVPSEADTDEDENTITLENSLLDYSADVYANIELDSETTVDVGDFLVFYRGTFGESDVQMEQYAKVTAVETKEAAAEATAEATEEGTEEALEATTTITYVVVDWETVQAAMDIYTKDQVEGSEMLEGVDKQQLESEIEQQAMDSGFAEEAALYLASVAMATDSFTELSGDIDLTDYRATLEDGTPLTAEDLQLMGSDSKVEAELSTLKAYISTDLKNFEGYSGLRLTLDVEVEITITPKSDSDNQIKITIAGAFEQEVRIDIGVSSSAVWKVWGIFPYIAEYRVSANVDLFDYTGIGINAKFVTAEKSEDDSWTENEEFKDLAEQMKKLMEAPDKYVGDGETSIADGLVDKYKDMLETESDWVSLFEKSMFEKEFHVPPCLPIIAIKIEVKFVVSANAVVSL